MSSSFIQSFTDMFMDTERMALNKAALELTSEPWQVS